MNKILTTSFLFLFFFQSNIIPVNPESVNFSIPVDLFRKTTLKILTWNIYMLPHCNLINHNHQRAKSIAETLNSSNYDIIIFQEAFDKGSRRILRQLLGNSYPFIYGPANESLFSLRTSSGIWVLSKIPLQKLKEIEYKNRFGIDAMARKGAVMFEGNWNGQLFQIVGTHLQADSPDEVRRMQCDEIAHELLEKYSKENVPQFVCGDFNIETSDMENYHYMLNVLNADNGIIEGDLHVTYDEIDNSLAKRENGKKRLIDYVLLRNKTNKLIEVKRRISVLKSKINNRMSDLSDHYGVEALISFR
jgi:sphingomyelin phosphodiesterase